MSTTIEVIAPTGYSTPLTMDLFLGSSTTATLSAIALTEVMPCVYRGTITTGPAGLFRVSVKSGSTPVVVTKVKLDGTPNEFVEASDNAGIASQVTAIQARIAVQVPNGPVIMLPAPAAGKTRAWSYCTADGGPLAGVQITIAAVNVTGGHGSFLSHVGTAASGSDGVASMDIPRVTNVEFEVWSRYGARVRFRGKDADTLELPAIIAK